jgi:hypothetical protein
VSHTTKYVSRTPVSDTQPERYQRLSQVYMRLHTTTYVSHTTICVSCSCVGYAARALPEALAGTHAAAYNYICVSYSCYKYICVSYSCIQVYLCLILPGLPEALAGYIRQHTTMYVSHTPVSGTTV